MMKRKIRAVIFDQDGTLVNSHPIVIESFRRAFAKFGITVGEKKLLSLFGRRIEEIIAELAPGKDQAALSRETQVYIMENFHKLRSFPGAKKTLSFLKKRKLKLAIVSGARPADLKRTAKTAGILRYFSLRVSCGNTKSGKLSGEPFRIACKRLAVSPAETIAVGDTFVDTAGAKKAGCIPVGVLSGGHKRAELAKAGAAKVLRSVADFPKYLKENYEF
jgi:HAD superfamily hydrolase (TIGR01509 family)